MRILLSNDLYYEFSKLYREIIMNNLISFNQLAASKHVITHNDEEKIEDYFNCLTHCDEYSQKCKRICKGHLIDI